MKIGLGAVQFGLDYGVSNRDGRTPQREVEKILAIAANNGIEVIDTAASYGDSEEVLGCAQSSVDAFRIVTKTPSFADRATGVVPADELEKTFHRSLERLRKSSVYGLLVHRVEDMIGDGGDMLLQRMKLLQSSGRVKKIGVSVYTAEQIDTVLGHCDIDLIQLPVSLLDQRLIRSGHLSRLKKRNVEIHARSIFLQGLFLMPIETLPAFFDPARTHLEACRQACSAAGVSPLAAALAFVHAIDEIDIVVCGVSNHLQLEEICAATRAEAPLLNWEHFALKNEFFLNPANWKLQ